MPKLLVLADDFTGSLDTGVQFAKAGISTTVLFSNFDEQAIANCDTQLLVLDLESRHDAPHVAYQKVFEISKKALARGVKHIYKKTDSALRGNIGAELSGLLDATSENALEFIPAFPKNGRTTKGGVHFVNGAKVADSVFGKDPFNPVRHSFVPDIIAEQSQVSVSLDENLKVPHICVHDAQTESDLAQIAKSLKNKTLIAGCAAFAEYLPEILELAPDSTERKGASKNAKILLVSGSVNDITLEQLRQAGKKHEIFTLDANECDITNAMSQKGIAIISSATCGKKPDFENLPKEKIEQLRLETADKIAQTACALFESLQPDMLAIFGGDTLIQIVRRLGCTKITPLYEISSGTVLCRAKNAACEFLLVSKSGGFGEKDIVEKIADSC